MRMMTFYSEKIQKQLSKTIQGFKNMQKRSNKTRLIQKQGKIKRVFKPRDSYLQKTELSQECKTAPILNFFNLIQVNAEAIRNPSHTQSYLRSNFFYKTIKKVEVMENYVVLSIKDSGLCLTSVQDTIEQYKRDDCLELRLVGLMLENLLKKMDIEAMRQSSELSLTNQAYSMLDSLGQTPFVCKIFSQKIVISKSFLELQGYNSEEFIIQSLKYRFPLFECISSQNYSKIIQTEIQFYAILFEALQKNVDFCPFLQNTYLPFMDTVTSKNNTQYRCKMSLSMPIPLVELMKIDEIVQANYKPYESHFETFGDTFKSYQKEVWEKQNKTLQKLIRLPVNFLSENKKKVSSYKDIVAQPHFEAKSEEDEPRQSVQLSCKIQHTLSEPSYLLE